MKKTKKDLKKRMNDVCNSIEELLRTFEETYPANKTPRKAIDLFKNYLNGKEIIDITLIEIANNINTIEKNLHNIYFINRESATKIHNIANSISETIAFNSDNINIANTINTISENIFTEANNINHIVSLNYINCTIIGIISLFIKSLCTYFNNKYIDTSKIIEKIEKNIRDSKRLIKLNKELENEQKIL